MRKPIKWKPGTPDAVLKLWEWQFHEATHFSAKLFELLAKADMDNFAKLACVFPEHAAAWEGWSSDRTPGTFWRQYLDGEYTDLDLL